MVDNWFFKIINNFTYVLVSSQKSVICYFLEYFYSFIMCIHFRSMLRINWHRCFGRIRSNGDSNKMRSVLQNVNNRKSSLNRTMGMSTMNQYWTHTDILKVKNICNESINFVSNYILFIRIITTLLVEKYRILCTCITNRK